MMNGIMRREPNQTILILFMIEYLLKSTKKDLFPYQMSTDQIVRVIRLAYEDAMETSKRQVPTKRDMVNVEWCSGTAIPYQGKAGDIVIRIWFDFDDNKISTAYPIISDPVTVKKEK